MQNLIQMPPSNDFAHVRVQSSKAFLVFSIVCALETLGRSNKADFLEYLSTSILRWHDPK